LHLFHLCLQERAPRAEGLLACANPKQERIRHAMLAACKLPPGFSSHTAREKQVLAAAAAFKERWVAGAATAAASGVPTRRLLPAVTMLNECGVEKVVCTTLRPASLPHVELYDLEGIAQASGRRGEAAGLSCVVNACWLHGMQETVHSVRAALTLPASWALPVILHSKKPQTACQQPAALILPQFVSEFFTYEPLEDPCRPPIHLVSPWSLLEWQVGRGTCWGWHGLCRQPGC
jgi:hypothetical protein